VTTVLDEIVASSWGYRLSNMIKLGFETPIFCVLKPQHPKKKQRRKRDTVKIACYGDYKLAPITMNLAHGVPYPA